MMPSASEQTKWIEENATLLELVIQSTANLVLLIVYIVMYTSLLYTQLQGGGELPCLS